MISSCRQTYSSLATNASCTGDKLFSPGDKHVESVCLNFSRTHTHSQVPATTKQNYVNMIPSHSYSPPKMGAITLWKFKRYLDAQWCLERKLYPNFRLLTVGWKQKLVTACDAYIQQSGCGLTTCICAMPGIHERKPQTLQNENVRRLWKQFQGCSLPIVAHKQVQTSRNDLHFIKLIMNIYN